MYELSRKQFVFSLFFPIMGACCAQISGLWRKVFVKEQQTSSYLNNMLFMSKKHVLHVFLSKKHVFMSKNRHSASSFPSTAC